MFSAAIVLGLGAGMLVLVKILEVVFFQYSFDHFHKNADQLYRVVKTRHEYGRLELKEPGTPLPMGPVIGRYPGIEKWARVLIDAPGLYIFYKKDEIIRTTTPTYYVDPSFLDMFTFPLLSGKKEDLSVINSIFLSQRMAEKLFHHENPIGKTVDYDEAPLVVRGVFADVPVNSSLSFDMLISLPSFPQLEEHFTWKDNTILALYLQLKKGVNRKAVGDEMTRIHQKNFSFKPYVSVQYSLQRLKDVHLSSSGIDLSYTRTFNGTLIRILLLFSGLIVLVFSINYINIYSLILPDGGGPAAKHRVWGVFDSKVFSRAFGESMIFILAGLLIACLIVRTPLPDSLMPSGYPAGEIPGTKAYWLIVAVVAGISLFAALIPAILLSAYKPKRLLRANVDSLLVGRRVRNALVVFQLIICIGLIGATLTVYRQFKYISGKDIGIDTKHVILVENPIEARPFQNAEGDAFRSRILKHKELLNFSFASYPGKPYYTTNIVQPLDSKVSKLTKVSHIDPDFLATYKVKLLAGRNLEPDNKTDMFSSLLVNESFVKSFGFKSPGEVVGKTVTFDSTRKYKIVGVIGDYNQVSLKNRIEPVCFRYFKWSSEYFSIRIRPGTFSKAIRSIKSEFGKVYPYYHFGYLRLDSFYDAQYDGDLSLRNWIMIITGLILFLSGVGVWAAFSCYMKKNEKNPANRDTPHIIVRDLIRQNYYRLLGFVLMAAVIGLSVAYFFMTRWLDHYAYRVNIGLGFWLIPPLILILVTIAAAYISTHKGMAGRVAGSLSRK